MALSVSIWSLIFFALLCANLPFVNQRLFALVRIDKFAHKKPFWLRLLELAICYFLFTYIRKYSYWKISPNK